MCFKNIVHFFVLVSLVFICDLSFADIFNLYNDAGIPYESQLWIWSGGGGAFNTVYDQEAPERVAYFRTDSQNWAGWGIFFDVEGGGSPYTLNMSNYSQGSLKFFVKTPINLKVEIREVGPSGPLHTLYIANYGWNGQNVWQEITIPISAFGANLTQIYSPFMITEFTALTPATFYVDYVRWIAPLPPSTPTSVTVLGRQLLVNNNVFTAKGVSAEFTPVGEYGPGYDWSLFPENYTPDIPLIAAMEANVIRTYDQRPTQKIVLDNLYSNGIYVIMGFPVDAVYNTNQNVDFGNQVVRDNIKNCFLDMVEHWKTHPAILGWCFGNEVNLVLQNQGVNPSNWYSLVEQCASAANALEGTTYHPVTTANADQAVWDIGNETIGADDASLAHLGLWSLQLYRGLNFGDAFTDYASLSNKPLLISEFGCDAYDGRYNQENQAMQANYLQSQWVDINDDLSSINPSDVCVGGIIFSWRDGWWKSSFGTPSTHDTQPDWTNNAYEDPNMNEEWWGLVAITSDPQARITRQAYDTISNLWEAPSITITYPQEGQVIPTLTPTITWNSTGMPENEEIHLIITHQNLYQNLSNTYDIKKILVTLKNIFTARPAYADHYMPLWIEDLNVIVPNTGNYMVGTGVLVPGFRYTLKLIRVSDPNINDYVNFITGSSNIMQKQHL